MSSAAIARVRRGFGDALEVLRRRAGVTGITQRRLTPWWASVGFHIVLILAAALIAVVGGSPGDGIGDGGLDARLFADQLIDDLTTLEPLDRAGDPFTDLDDVTPSLSVEATDPKRVNLPAFTERYGPVLSDPEVDVRVERPDRFVPGEALAITALGGMTRLSPFSGRSAEARAALLRREGGTAESEQAVEQGLDWIARHQGRGGYWSLDPRPNCPEGPCPGETAMQSNTAATGLALLTLMGAGHTHDAEGRYREPIERGLKWLRSVQEPSGELFIGGGGESRMYSHAIAAMALCEAYGVTRDPELREPAERAIGFIIRSQNPDDGGWRYQPGDAGDTSVFGWQMICLRSGSIAGIPVPAKVINGCRNYLDAAAADVSKSTYAYRPGSRVSPVMTAEALLCRQYLGWSRDSAALRKGAAQVYKHSMTSGDRNLYYWYYAAQLLHNIGGEPWERWNQRIREELIANQVGGKGCDRGSWDPSSPQPDRWGRAAGRHFTTCLSLLTLEVYYRYLPLYRERDEDPL